MWIYIYTIRFYNYLILLYIIVKKKKEVNTSLEQIKNNKKKSM